MVLGQKQHFMHLLAEAMGELPCAAPEMAWCLGRADGDTSGSLYGTTALGGAYGCGTVFKLARSVNGWKESLLHIFACGRDGNFPAASVTFDHAGNL